MNLSYYLKLVRLNAGLSQRDLALRTGIAATLLSRYETGKLNPRADTLQKIATETGVPLVNFFQAQAENTHRDENESFMQRQPLMSKNMLLPVLEAEEHVVFEKGRCQFNKAEMRQIPFPFETFIVGMNKKNIVGYFIDDLSMEQQFKQGSLVLIDTGQRALVSGRFVCILWSGRLVLRYVASHNQQTTTFVATAKDSLIPPLSLDTDDFDIVGTIVWKSEVM